ncbi:hypothetical protein [Dokdonia sp. Asnod2-E02]|uniref:hypothetical protein n=1 Tax=Dokdonia sp. Asnod2-E02 TaxID=3160574 RepID=UPI0038688782
MRKTLLILLPLYLFTVSLNAQETLSCSDFREGTFVVPGSDTIPSTTIVRKGNQQTEILNFNGVIEESIINLSWIDDCSYTIVFSKETPPVNVEMTEEEINMIITVTMISFEGNCATFQAEGNGRAKGHVITGKICKEESI